MRRMNRANANDGGITFFPPKRRWYVVLRENFVLVLVLVLESKVDMTYATKYFVNKEELSNG